MLVDYHLNDEYMKPGADVLKKYIKLANSGVYEKASSVNKLIKNNSDTHRSITSIVKPHLFAYHTNHIGLNV